MFRNKSNDDTACFEQNKCFTFLSGRQLVGEEHILAVGTVSYILIPFAILANTVLLFHLRINRTIPVNFRRLLQILASADLLVGVIALPLFASVLIFYGESCHCSIELVCQFVSAAFGGLSGRTTGMIAVDRFIHIKYYHIYPLMLTTKYKTVLYSVSLVVSLLSATLTTLGTLLGVYPQICGALTVFDIIVLGSVMFLYLSAWRSVNRHVRTSLVWNSKSRRPKYNLLLAKKVTGILIILNICYGPFVVTNFLRSFLDSYFAGSTLTLLNLWSYNVLFANSVLNAVVLLRKDSQLRKSTPFNVQVLPIIPRRSNRDRALTGEGPCIAVIHPGFEMKRIDTC